MTKEEYEKIVNQVANPYNNLNSLDMKLMIEYYTKPEVVGNYLELYINW